MHVDLDFAATARDGFKQRLPEGIASFRDSALPVHAKREPLNLRAFLQKNGQRIAAILCMRLGRKPFDTVMCVRTVGPLVSMGPQSQLEFQSPRTCFGGDKTQHLKIFLPLLRGKRSKILFSRLAAKPNHPHIVTRYVDEIWVREVEVVAGHAAREVVANSKGEVEAIEAAGHQEIQIASPKIPVVVPGLVFDFTAECASNASDFICGLFL